MSVTGRGERLSTTPFVSRVLAALVIVFAVVVIYARSTSAYFFNDDFHWLVQTQSFEPANLLDLSQYQHFYRPVIEVYFLAGLALFGCNAAPYHATSVAFHLFTTGLVWQLARAVSSAPAFAFLAALFFAVQPGLVDAVTWIAAITDLLPVFWYVAAVWLHLKFLDSRRPALYVATLGAFVLCHLTQESAATLLPMLLLTEYTFAASGTSRERLRTVASHCASYAPHAAVLTLFLLSAYIVNTRSYLVQEGHYAFGWHSPVHILNYLVLLYVGQRALVDYAATLGALGAVLLWGQPRLRFAVVWMLATLLPVSFFTWENAPRYLYLPAVGFALLAADLMLMLEQRLRRHLPAARARAVLAIVVALLAVRFAIFAKKAADSFPARTAPYERFVTELRRANPGAVAGSSVFVEQRFLAGVPELYREPAARIGLCLPDLRLQVAQSRSGSPPRSNP